MATGTQGPPDDVQQGTKKLLRQTVKEWVRLTERIQEIRQWLGDPAGGPRPDDVDKVQEYVQQRHDDAEQVFNILKDYPGLAEEVQSWGFAHEGFSIDDYKGQGPTPDGAQGSDESQPGGGGKGGSGDGTGTGTGSGSGGGKGAGGGKTGPPIDHLPGKEGVDYHFVKGPGGVVKVVFDMDIPGPREGGISFTIPKELYDRYNVHPDKVKQLTAAQMKRLEGFGPINEIQLRRGEHPFQSWLRQMKQKFGMAPSMLRDKEVMQVLYAAHLGQWDQARLLGALQQTKWYDTKTKTRIDYLFKMGTADRKTAINSTVNQISDYVRQQFGGVDWTQHGINESKIKDWAHNVISGKTGWDLTEVQSRIDEFARGVEGTTLWANEEQASQSALEQTQEWEDIFEKYRSENIRWLGPNGRSSRDTITKFAKQRASGEITDADYQQFLRKQQHDLFPYITGDRTWEEFADPYKAALQRIMGDNASIDWTHPLLSDLGSKDNKGNPTNAALSLYDFNLMARDPKKNPSAYDQGTALFDQGMDKLEKILQRMRGVAA